MVRRAVERVVQGHFHAVSGRCPDQVVEVVEGAEVRVQGGVAPLLRPDGPRAPGVARAGGEGIVPSLAESVADRVDGRKVQDVKTQPGQPGDLPGGTPQAPEAAWEQLVPGPDGGEGTIGPDGAGGRNSQSVANFSPARASATGADRARFIRAASSRPSSCNAARAWAIGPSATDFPVGVPPFRQEGDGLRISRCAHPGAPPI